MRCEHGEKIWPLCNFFDLDRFDDLNFGMGGSLGVGVFCTLKLRAERSTSKLRAEKTGLGLNIIAGQCLRLVGTVAHE